MKILHLYYIFTIQQHTKGLNNLINFYLESIVFIGHNRKRNQPVNWTTTLGLVVHAAADGIALGAAAATHQLDVEVIVFFAIMLHKAPAAFGLVTFLLHEGLDRNRARKHLMIFSVSAPTMAVITFICLTWSGDSGGKVSITFIFALPTRIHNIVQGGPYCSCIL